MALIGAMPTNAAAQDDPDSADEEAVTQLVARLVAALGDARKDSGTARTLIAALPDPPPARAIAALREHDRAGVYAADDAGRALRRELFLALGRSGDFRSLHYLYEAFEAQPTRRQDAAEAFVQYAARHGRRSEEWQMLVRSLPILDPPATREILRSLATFPRRGSKPKWQREVILAGLRLNAQDRDVAVRLLEHWTGQKQVAAGDTPAAHLATWQAWFERTYPELPAAQLPVDPAGAKFKFAELLIRIRRDVERGNVERGSRVFDKALCSKCHRMGMRGEAMGPDLTSTPHRFQDGEVLEAILFPSQSIADDYGAVSVLTTGGRVFTGVVNAAAGKVTVLQPNGEKVVLAKKEVDQVTPQRKSAMPDGLIDPLDEQEIVDLFAFLLHREVR